MNFKGVNEIDHLENDQTHIYIDYDHISDSYKKVQKIRLVVPKLEI